MKDISIKAVIVAAVAVLVVDVVAGIGLTIALSDETIGTSEEAITALTGSTPFLLGSVILGTLSTVLGGYIAARLAKTSHYANAAVIGCLGILLGIFTAIGYPLWFNIAGFLLVLPAALLGGHLAKPAAQANAYQSAPLGRR